MADVRPKGTYSRAFPRKLLFERGSAHTTHHGPSYLSEAAPCTAYQRRSSPDPSSALFPRRHIHRNHRPNHFIARGVNYGYRYTDVLSTTPLRFVQARRGADTALCFAQIFNRHAAGNPSHGERNGDLSDHARGKLTEITHCQRMDR